MRCPKPGKFKDGPCGRIMKVWEDGFLCTHCSHYVASEVVAKPLGTSQRCGSFDQIDHNKPTWGNTRQESQQAAKMRCEDFFEKFKEFLKVELSKARTFKSIWGELKAGNPDLPSRSWLKSRYTQWVKEGEV